MLGLLLAIALIACGGDGGGGGGGRGGKGGKGGKRGDKGGWGGGEEASAPGPERRLLIEAQAVEKGSVEDHLVTSGTLESETQADITPEANGIITRVLVEEGDAIRQGQLLAVIQNPSLDASAERAGVELNRARDAYDDAVRLRDGGAISDRELREARDALALAEASYQEAVQSAGFARIESPIAGTLAVRDVRVGEVASSAQRAFQVVDLLRLRVIVQLPERDLPRIREGLPAVLTGAYDEEARADGTIERISPVVDAGTGTVRVTIRVDPGQTALRPGQFVKVRIEVDRHEDVVVIPRRALVYQDGEPVAWVVADGEAPEPPAAGDGGEEAGEAGREDAGGFFADLFGGGGDDADADEDGADAPEEDPWEGIPRRVAEKRRLEIGFTDADLVEVGSGLEIGELVVTVGNSTLREEALLRLPDDPMPRKKKKKDDDKKRDGDDDASGDG